MADLAIFSGATMRIAGSATGAFFTTTGCSQSDRVLIREHEFLVLMLYLSA